MSLQAIADSRLGRVLRGKYRLVRVLGVGGMASVYQAEHRNRRLFAVKMLHPEFSHHEDIRARFLREGYAANSVSHVGAVAVLDDDVDEDGTAFLVMELLDGESVEQLWERRGMVLPVASVLALAEQLLDVLQAAHAHGIVHRDLKPANLFITRDGTLKVLDFGIARLTEPEHPQSTKTGQTLGTPAFMSPEQATGNRSAVGPQTDLWSAGATLFLLLSGRYVFETETAHQLLIALAMTPARSVATVVSDLEPAVARLVDGALISDPAARFADAAAMQSALHEAWSALGAESTRATSQHELSRLFADETRTAPALVEPRATPPAGMQSWLFPAVPATLALLATAGLIAVLRSEGAMTVSEIVPQDGALPTQSAGSAVPALPPLPHLLPTATPAAGARVARRPQGSPRGIDPRAAQQVLAAPESREGSAPAATPSETCTRFLERQSLGDDLDAQELATFERECRQ